MDMKRLLTISCITVVCTVHGLILVLLALFFREMHLQATLLAEVESRLGCRITAPHVEIDGKLSEEIAITKVESGGPFDKAGCHEDDIVVEQLTIGQICQRLAGPSGTTVTLEVVDGGDGLPFGMRSRRRLSIVLP